jgi:hypothetical protein
MKKTETARASFFARHPNTVGLLLVFGILAMIAILVFVFAKPCLPCAFEILFK